MGARGASGRFISQGLSGRLDLDTSGWAKGLSGAVKSASKAGKAMARRFMSIVKAATVVALAVTAIGVAAVRMASTFETGMAEVFTLLDAGVEETRRLTAEVKQLSIAFGVATTVQAKALYQVISAGATEAADATRILTQANIAAVAGVTDVAIAAEAISRVLNAYGLASSEATKVSDLLFQTVRKGVTTFGELAPSIGRVAGTAAAVGVSFTELSAAIATATKRLKIEEVVTGVNALLLSFVSRTTETEAAAKALGIQFDASALAAHGLAGMMSQVVEKLGLPVEELMRLTGAGDGAAETMGLIANKTGVAVETITALFPNIRALRVALALVADNGQEFADMMGDMETAGGSTQVAFDKMAETFGFLTRQVKTELSVAMVDLGETLLPIARDLVTEFSGVVTTTREWVNANRDLIAQNVGAVIEAAVNAVGNLGGILVNVVDFFRRHDVLLIGEFGLVGFVLLGPAGAAGLTALGVLVSAFLNDVLPPTTVRGAFEAKLAEIRADQRRLSNTFSRAEMDMPSHGRRGLFDQKRLEEFTEEMGLLEGAAAGVELALKNLGPQAENAFEDALASARDLFAAMSGFALGRGGGGGGGGPAKVIADDMNRVAESTRNAARDGIHLFTNLRALHDPLSAAAFAARAAAQATEDWDEHVARLADTIHNQLVSGLADLLLNLQDVGSTVRWLGQLIFRELVTSLIQAQRAGQSLSSVLGSFGPVGLIGAGVGLLSQFFHHGGIVQPQAGFAGAGGVPAMVQPGEVVLSRSAVRSLGGAMAANSLNAGGSVSGGPVVFRLSESDVPEPVDYGLLGTRPQAQRLVMAVLRNLQRNGASF